MLRFASDVSPPVRSRGSTGLVLCALAVALVSLALVSGSASPAQAATPHATPPAAPAAAPSAPPSIAPTPAAPTIDDLGDRLARFPLDVTGTGEPGDHLEISGASGGTSCRAPVAADGTWGCSLSGLPDGPAIVVRAVSLDTGVSARTRTIAVLSAPTISAPAGGLVTGGGIRGTAYPGATVSVRASNGSGCSFPADSTGAWGCVLTPAVSGQFTVTASQRGPAASFPAQNSDSSPAVSVTVDTTPPAAPTITSPGATSIPSGDPLTFGGAGEAGASVTVYASNDNGSSMVCTATVQGAAWSCVGSMPPGTYLVSALQTDAAGNVSAGGNTVSIQFTAPRPDPDAKPAPSSPSKSPTATPGPAVPVPPGATPSPSPSGPNGGPHLPGMPGWMGTPFSTASAPMLTAEAFPGWLRSLILAVAALLLLALPARLLASTIGRNRAERGRRRMGIFGRNRSTSEIRDAEAGLPTGRARAAAHVAGGPSGASPDPGAASVASVTRWSIYAAFAAAAALVVLSSPVDDTAAYVRVIIAVALALAAVNAAWVGIAHWAAPHLAGQPARIVFYPLLLVVIGTAAVGSRVFGLQPALLFGLLLGVVLTESAGRVARGRVAATQVAAIAALGVVAWLTVGLLPEPSGIGSAFAVELANAVSLLGLGSAAVSLLPVGGLAGRAVFQWSRWVWIGLSLIVYTLLFALLLPVASLVETGQSSIVLILAAIGFAVLSVCIWLWERYVEPERR